MFGNKDNMSEVGPTLSIIRKGMRITCTVKSTGQVACAWQIEGSIESDSLHILPCRKFNGEMVNNLVIADYVLAGIVCTKIQFAKNVYFNDKLFAHK